MYSFAGFCATLTPDASQRLVRFIELVLRAEADYNEGINPPKEAEEAYLEYIREFVRLRG